MPRLHVEDLGARILPSANHLIATAAPAHLSLAGYGTGGYLHEFAIPDMGQQYDLLGIATLQGLGRVSVKGSVDTVGFILHGHAWGLLTFTNAKGSVTLLLEGPEQNGFAPLPRRFTFDVIGGTGSYQHLSEPGTLQLVISPAVHAQGTFTLTIGLTAMPLR
jgi:hypothetical protein